jgi:uncharacterized protein
MSLRASLPAVCILLSQLAAADTVPRGTPAVALIIDDLGYSLTRGRRAIDLPGAITCAILPGAPHARSLALYAGAAGKEIMLHLPMQGIEGSRSEPGSLSGQMDEDAFRAMLREHLAAVPEAAGVNNHMGSSVTPLAEQMDWLMDELADKELYFVDSRTTHMTVGADAARSHRVRFTQRDVFLDNEKDPAAIVTAFQQLIRKAKKRGRAVAIAHAHPVTLATLERLLPTLAEEGIVLEPVSRLLPQNAAPSENLTARHSDGAEVGTQSAR